MQNIKEYVANKKEELRAYINSLTKKLTIAVVQVGDDPASCSYIKGKLKDCAEVGIECKHLHFPDTISEHTLLDVVDLLNSTDQIDGFIVQLPLPKHISEAKVIEAIDPKKDIDGFTKKSYVSPATPQGVLTYLEDNNFKFVDCNAVIIGRSNIVGRPMAKLLLNKSCNVSVIHSKTSTENKQALLKNANLVVVATGHRDTVTNEDFVINKTVYTENDGGLGFNTTYNMPFIVDVGMNKNDEGKLCGDCESITCTEKTPVPGGVGLLTRLALLLNTVKLYKINNNID